MLAATLSPSYGIYSGFENVEATAVAPGSEEYLDSEKYEIKRWDRDRPGNLRELISRLNAIRHDNPALQSDWSLRFHTCDNDQLLCYSKEEGDNLIFVCVNLDPRYTQAGFVDFDRAPGDSYVLDDLVAGSHYTWSGRRNFVQLDPHTLPAHVFRVTRK